MIHKFRIRIFHKIFIFGNEARAITLEINWVGFFPIWKFTNFSFEIHFLMYGNFSSNLINNIKYLNYWFFTW
jgi:hypothetical protein